MIRTEAAAGDPAGPCVAVIFGAAVENGWTLLELVEKKASLEDVFVRLTGNDNGQEPAPDAPNPCDTLECDAGIALKAHEAAESNLTDL